MADKKLSNLFRGDYDNSTAYTIADFVKYQGSAYVCIENTTGNLPTDTDFWYLFLTGIDKVTNEVPSGTVNGANADFTLANTPSEDSEQVFVNGMRMKGGGEDYTISGAVITFETAPPTNSNIIVDYAK